jgi:hypothetical protein
MGKVAGVVVGDGHRLARAGELDDAKLVEKLGDVTHARGECPRGTFLCPAAEHVAVLLHRRPAPGGVRHDRVDVSGKGVHERPCARLRPALLAGMEGQRAAARLRPRHHDVDTIGREHAERRVVDCRVEHLLDAAGQQRDPGPPWRARWHHGWQGLRRGQVIGQEREHRPQGGRKRSGGTSYHLPEACREAEHRR